MDYCKALTGSLKKALSEVNTHYLIECNACRGEIAITDTSIKGRPIVLIISIHDQYIKWVGNQTCLSDPELINKIIKAITGGSDMMRELSCRIGVKRWPENISVYASIQEKLNGLK